MTKDRLQPEESEVLTSLGVYEETAILRKALMWGAPGAETVLGQLLPSEISCFQTQFDVSEARREFKTAQTILEKEGVEVILVKDLFAKMIHEKGLKPEGNLGRLKQRIIARALDYYKMYRDKGVSDIEEVLPWVDETLEADVEKYGEEAAVL